MQPLILGSKISENFKKWLGSKIFQTARISKVSNKAGKGNRKVCCRFFGSAGDKWKLYEYKIIKKDDEGIIVDDESLEVMLASCLDFANEITEVQAKGEEMEVRVIPTTKFYAEMAGKGIEFLWGVRKDWHPSKPLEFKRRKASFLQLVHKVLDPESVRSEKKV
jgi:hypothetical protein